MLHLLAVKHARQLRTEKQDETGNITPGKHRDHGPDRAVNLFVVKIIQSPGKDILCDLPQQAADESAGNAITHADICVRHESIDDQEQSESDKQAAEGKHNLPE